MEYIKFYNNYNDIINSEEDFIVCLEGSNAKYELFENISKVLGFPTYKKI